MQKAHPNSLQLRHGCNGKHAARYKPIYKLYKQAAKLYATNGSRVVEEAVVSKSNDDVVLPFAVAENTGRETYPYHTPRKGAMYYKPIPPFQRDCNMRRSIGGGGNA